MNNTRITKKSQQSYDRFNKAVTGYLISKGATPGEFYALRIETTLGLLHVSPHDDWIATRFDDVDRAKSVLGSGRDGRLNPYSGKWNFHFADGTPVAEALHYFATNLEPLLK